MLSYGDGAVKNGTHVAAHCPVNPAPAPAYAAARTGNIAPPDAATTETKSILLYYQMTEKEMISWAGDDENFGVFYAVETVTISSDQLPDTFNTHIAATNLGVNTLKASNSRNSTDTSNGKFASPTVLPNANSARGPQISAITANRKPPPITYFTNGRFATPRGAGKSSSICLEH
ncbi:hypothetical protein Bhyg_04867 [Pseudolycoriella hygida]|uniref:Uncharacterized protein n=1 Tax=Pseudolycoriella hygida TaxID=35572 RepID=A0A9Q0S8Q8_9DIPT|nr:hypothetical protein Bhyg_04867 [Pseudolycoriella hygida]